MKAPNSMSRDGENAAGAPKWAVLLAVVAVVGFTGCVSHQRSSASTRTSHSVEGARESVDRHMLVFRQRADGTSAVFESEKMTLIFPDLKRSERNSFDGEELAIQVGGEGRSETTRSCNRNGRVTTFRAVYENGISTVTFCGREVKLMDEARTVMVGGKAIDLKTATTPVTVVARTE